MTAQSLIKDLKDIDKNDISIVGGKSANLGEMIKADFPVPNGFATTVLAYETFLSHNIIEDKVYDILKITDVSDPEQLNQASKRIQRLIVTGEIPKDVRNEVIKAYIKLSGFRKNALVAVRSSATAEDMPGTSFAGQQSTFLNIKGDANLLNAVRECWASLFTPRSIFYRVQNKIKHTDVKISVIVQKMIQSEASGVIFTIDPVTKAKDRIIIEAVWGLGEMIVQGTVVPDCYVVQKDTFDILSKSVSDQKIQLIKKGIITKEQKVNKRLQNIQKITDNEIVQLAKIADKLHQHYYFPQDIEWAKEKRKLYIVQTRPITSIESNEIKKDIKRKDSAILASKPILSGTPASPGIGVGIAKIIKSAKEISKIALGDVLVSVMTSPDFVPAMKKACAIVTNEGGMTSHAAIVSRELGIPCVVGTKTATKTIQNGQVISVDGSNGNIFLGSFLKSMKAKEKKGKVFKAKTATKIYVNLAEPDRANEIAKLNIDGVGLLRAEFMMANIGVHPKEAIKKKKQEVYIEKLTNGIKIFCKAFYPRPVVYRATDFKTNEYRMLEGGKVWEPVESNPMLGFRGAFRYVANPEVFTLELKALKNVMKEYNNLNLMIPFVRSPEELKKVKKIVEVEGLFSHTNFKFWMMVELPVNIILLEDFIKVGIDGISIGSNDLTMLILGTDRDNSEVAQAFDENSPSVLWAIKKTIKTCNKLKVTSSICGQAPSVYDGYIKNLVEWGITSISVNPDSINRVRESVYRVENNIINNKEYGNN